MESNERENIKQEKIFSRDFAFIWLANFFVFLGFQMTLPTIPIFVNDLGGSDQLIGIIVGIFTFSALLFRPYAGHALETKGRGVVYLFGLALFVLSVGSFGLIASMTFLIIMRIVQGIGWGFSTTASGTIATDLIPPKRRGEGMGYYGLSGNLALAFGPALGLTLADVLTFKQLFLICAGLGLIALIIALNIKYKKVDESPHKTQLARFDVIEKTAINPSILLFFITLTFGGITSFLPLYAAEKSIEGIQLYFISFALFLMLSRIFAGRIYDRKGDLYVIPPGTILIFTAMLLLAWLPNMMTMIVAGALYGLGFGTVQPALQAWAVDKAPNNRKGMANATFFSFFDLGVGVGAILFGQLAFLFNYGIIYVVSACSVLVALMFYTFLIVTGRRKVRKVNL
ncbi:MFS transporter [Pseudogracilibacillus auburnensis]|uniref:Putative MFS family arabinose efflux permease n=1 Tax=Pseudogracilibacillus auburnensis TaxID=1494959 RepID=A0A2V3WF67_9BACI|nr:MFS transporter [Pseudogracilibacillus auburnensis]MBO1002173.1 MFS transporter [Pseudogracilibacillus auburnensis]PXW87499.1 putative MFS family arabinose efflux permease [Pseudogracilibacillus auburnensis]